MEGALSISNEALLVISARSEAVALGVKPWRGVLPPPFFHDAVLSRPVVEMGSSAVSSGLGRARRIWKRMFSTGASTRDSNSSFSGPTQKLRGERPTQVRETVGEI